MKKCFRFQAGRSRRSQPPVGLIGVAAHRCPNCGHDVTRDALGVRTHKSWPKVSETCASCGAGIP